jgi:hypothetical protein
VTAAARICFLLILLRRVSHEFQLFCIRPAEPSRRLLFTAGFPYVSTCTIRCTSISFPRKLFQTKTHQFHGISLRFPNLSLDWDKISPVDQNSVPFSPVFLLREKCVSRFFPDSLHEYWDKSCNPKSDFLRERASGWRRIWGSGSEADPLHHQLRLTVASHSAFSLISSLTHVRPTSFVADALTTSLSLQIRNHFPITAV